MIYKIAVFEKKTGNFIMSYETNDMIDLINHIMKRRKEIQGNRFVVSGKQKDGGITRFWKSKEFSL